ncbi:hypothetical protein BKA69DRAFT_1034712 [Paraphysoderma sedebokerense]|nr:hypothetical protein BKA69DRAFT_1034712 [Paraphysoderma sedebokerense]
MLKKLIFVYVLFLALVSAAVSQHSPTPTSHVLHRRQNSSSRPPSSSGATSQQSQPTNTNTNSTSRTESSAEPNTPATPEIVIKITPVDRPIINRSVFKDAGFGGYEVIAGSLKLAVTILGVVGGLVFIL